MRACARVCVCVCVCWGDHLGESVGIQGASALIYQTTQRQHSSTLHARCATYVWGSDCDRCRGCVLNWTALDSDCTEYKVIGLNDAGIEVVVRGSKVDTREYPEL